MKYSSFIFILLGLFVFSCNQDYHLKDYTSLSKKRWYKENIVKIEYDNKENLGDMLPELLFRFVKGTAVKAMDLSVEIELPDGTKKIEFLKFKLSREGCLGDICDLAINFNEVLDLRHIGKYVFSIKSNMQEEYTPNIIYLGIEI